MRPICVKCGKEMKTLENEVLVKDRADGGFPSTYHYGDLYGCPVCKACVITGFGKAIEAEKIEGTIAEKRAITFDR